MVKFSVRSPVSLHTRIRRLAKREWISSKQPVNMLVVVEKATLLKSAGLGLDYLAAPSA